MTNGDMRYGRCGICGAHEVYNGEVTGLGVRGTEHYGGKMAVFDAYICGACGHTQLHLTQSASMHSYIRRRFVRVPPAAPPQP